MKIVTRQGDTVDKVCWQRYGQTSGMVEKVLNANPHLSRLGPVLPVGTTIELPEVPTTYEQKPTINLWD